MVRRGHKDVILSEINMYMANSYFHNLAIEKYKYNYNFWDF